MMKRIIMHWSAGTYEVSEADREHYHKMVDGDGNVHNGEHNIEDNESTSDDDYAAHTKSLNTGSIGVALCAMAGAVQSPFDVGDYPITDVQLHAFANLIAELAKEYEIPIGRTTVLSHAEVEPTLGVKQDGKWDIMWLPGMVKPDNPVKVGDAIRSMIDDCYYKPPTATYEELEKRVAALEEWASTFHH